MMLPVMPNSEPTKDNSEQSERSNGLGKMSLFKRNSYFIEDHINFRSGSKKCSGFKLALWSWMSAFIDSLILTSISCFTVILFSFLMKTSARDIFKFISIEPNITKMFVVSFLFSFWVYLIMMRIFMGASLGEWSCQLRLGQPVQRIKTSYIFKVIARTTLILLTGVITLPILSLIFKRDLVGEITGIRIYSL